MSARKMVDVPHLFSRVLDAVNESIRAKNKGAGIRETADDLLAAGPGRPRILASVDALRRVADEYDAMAERWDHIAESYTSMIAKHCREVLAERQEPSLIRPCGF